MRSGDRVVVIGAGVGGLAAALELSARGLDVTVLERAAAPGGKMRQVMVDGRPVDAGPTVFTMRWVFEELFAAAGAFLADHLTLHPAEVLARHAWDGASGPPLDLFADPDRAAEAIGAFAGAGEARGYRDFCARARRIYAALEGPFIRSPRPTALSLMAGAGPAGVAALWDVSPFASLWRALGENFRDPRLRQLFGRYATYCGSSPFNAPATLMLIAHVEQEGVWLPEGGMHALARALEGLAAARGAAFRYGAEAAEVLVESGRVAGVRLADGDRIAADAVVANADANALAEGRLGAAAARAVPGIPWHQRSLSAVTWCLHAEASGFPLLRHTVFFSRDYEAEFEANLGQGEMAREPTVYVCAQDRDAATGAAPGGPERLLVLVNAPALGDRPADGGRGGLTPKDTDACESATFLLLSRCGLTVRRRPEAVVTTPRDFDRLFPGTGGALYGRATHGPWASFARPGARTALPGLYLAGGSAHPGAGVPMAALSGRLAAAAVMTDRASTPRWRRAATLGGTWTR